MAWKRKSGPSRTTVITEEEWEELRELVQGIKTGTIDAHTIPADLQNLINNDGFFKLTCSECDRLEGESTSLDWPVYVWVLPTEEEPEETDSWPAISYHTETIYPISFEDIIHHSKKHQTLTIERLIDLSKTTWKVLNWTGPQVKQLLGLE